LEFVKKLKTAKSYQLYLISGRYSFLKTRTDQWLRQHKIDNLFEGVFINLNNEQPHFFKEKMVKKLAIDIFVDDDLPLAEYLAKSIPQTKVFCFDQKKKKQSCFSVFLIDSLEEILLSSLLDRVDEIRRAFGRRIGSKGPPSFCFN